MKLQAQEYRKILNNLEPIYVPPTKDNRIVDLEKDLSQVKYDYIMSLVKGAEFPAAKTAHANIEKLLQDHENKQRIVQQDIKRRADNIAVEIMNEYLQRKPYRSVKGDFSQFPSNELTKALVH